LEKGRKGEEKKGNRRIGAGGSVKKNCTSKSDRGGLTMYFWNPRKKKIWIESSRKKKGLNKRPV